MNERNAPSANQQNAALFGTFAVTLGDGTAVECRPALQMLKDAAAAYAPELSETDHHSSCCRSQKGRPSVRARKTIQLLHLGRPRTRQRRHANQPRGLLLLRAHRPVRSARQQRDLRHHTDQSHQRARTTAKKKSGITPRHRETSARAARRSRPGASQREVYDAILTGKPYPIKAMVLFGSDPLLGHGDPLRGKAALEALDFYMHVDTTINPSAMFADLILPATTCWEHEALMPSFEIAEDTMNWAQLRPAVAKPVGESRSDIEIIFDLAQRLGLPNSSSTATWKQHSNHQLAPSELTGAATAANSGRIACQVTDTSSKIRRDRCPIRQTARLRHSDRKD